MGPSFLVSENTKAAGQGVAAASDSCKGTISERRRAPQEIILPMAGAGWNRNIHYHDIVLAAVPKGCHRALDVGCGDGRLASELAEICDEVIGIDNHAPTLARARAKHQLKNLSFVDGDIMSHPFALESFNF